MRALVSDTKGQKGYSRVRLVLYVLTRYMSHICSMSCFKVNLPQTLWFFNFLMPQSEMYADFGPLLRMFPASILHMYFLAAKSFLLLNLWWWNVILQFHAFNYEKNTKGEEFTSQTLLHLSARVNIIPAKIATSSFETHGKHLQRTKTRPVQQ